MAAKRKVWDYIFLHKRTPWKPEVLRIAAASGQSRRETWAAIAEFWCWVDDNCEDGLIPGADVPFLSQVCPGTVPEFWAEMSRVGWIEFIEDGARIPNFDRWMGTTAKKRNSETRRKSVLRSETGQTVGQRRDKDGTKSGTRALQEIETEREKDIQGETPLPPCEPARKKVVKEEPITIPQALDTPEFRQAWVTWLQHRKEKRNPVTPTAQKAQMKKLTGMGLQKALETLENSTAQSYTGLFPPSANGKPDRKETESTFDRVLREKTEREAKEREQVQ